METADVTVREDAVLVGGPADGVRVVVAGRPRVVQVTYPCGVEGGPDGVRVEGVRVEGVYVYRRVLGEAGEGGGAGRGVRYGFDVASP
ncbi:hypothetical protein [Streptomyces sp. NPDC004042]|uniref:hypothetical protein n=1 Tax=Streptomyces sp. NPDC004042 TaxID=3154451 RepID=UPI0033B69E76